MTIKLDDSGTIQTMRMRPAAPRRGFVRTAAQTIREYRAHLRALAAGALLFAVVGCVAPPPATVATGGPASGELEQIAQGDWDDVDAAVRTAARLEQIVIESRREYGSVRSGIDQGDYTNGPGVIVYSLRTARGDSGELSLKRLDGDGGIRVRCRIGVLGSASAEAAIVGRVVDRLGDLHGKAYAPVSD